jgi:hypothetical protein
VAGGGQGVAVFALVDTDIGVMLHDSGLMRVDLGVVGVQMNLEDLQYL